MISYNMETNQQDTQILVTSLYFRMVVTIICASCWFISILQYDARYIQR